MRLAEVEQLRLRVSASDTDSVMAKLAGYLNSASLYLESFLETKFLEEQSVDTFYLDSTSPFIKLPTIRLMLGHRFIKQSGNPLLPIVTVHAFSTAADAVIGSGGSALVQGTDFKVNIDTGVVILLSPKWDMYLRVVYTHGFDFETDESYEDLHPVNYDTVPDWLEEAALAIGARLYQAESRELDMPSVASLWKDVNQLVQPQKRLHVSAFKPLPL